MVVPRGVSKSFDAQKSFWFPCVLFFVCPRHVCAWGQSSFAGNFCPGRFLASRREWTICSEKTSLVHSILNHQQREAFRDWKSVLFHLHFPECFLQDTKGVTSWGPRYADKLWLIHKRHFRVELLEGWAKHLHHIFQAAPQQMLRWRAICYLMITHATQ